MAAYGIHDPEIINERWTPAQIARAHQLIQRRKVDEGNRQYQIMLHAAAYGVNNPKKAPSRLFSMPDDSDRPTVNALNAADFGLSYKVSREHVPLPDPEKSPIRKWSRDEAAQIREKMRKHREEKKRRAAEMRSVFSPRA